MMQSNQKSKAKIGSTQKFTDIVDIVENIVLLSGGNACLVIEVQASNFSLLSQEEQDSKINSYANFLNSLSFPIQIVVRSKKIDISSYISLLNQQITNTQTIHPALSLEQNQLLTSYMQKYKDFVQELVKVNSVLDKQFHIVIPFSYLETGALSSAKGAGANLLPAAKSTLRSKADSVLAQLARLSLRAKILEKEELVRLFHGIYNQNQTSVTLETTSILDVIAPSSIEVDFRFIRVGEAFYKTFFVVEYPRFVSANWLQPLIDFDHSLDIALFIYPTTASDVLSDLRRKIAEMEATIASQADSGQAIDPLTSAALEDALALQEELAKGVERLFQTGLYITVSSENLLDLESTAKQLSTTLSSLLLLPKSATLQMEQGFKTTLPQGTDHLFITRNMDTTSLASTFPFTSNTLTQDKGVLYGLNKQNNSLVIFDRYSLENANEVVLGKSGSGKSFLIKLEAMRQFMLGTEIIIVDPEGEYESIAKTVGGISLEFTTSSSIKLNPFDLSGLYEEGENELGLKILSLHGLLRIITGELDAAHDAILDHALVETYQQKGITADPKTQKQPPPIMDDLYKTLLGMQDPNAKELALRLEKFINGSMSGIFNQQSNFDITSPFTVFSIRGLEDELRPIAMHIILDYVWTKIRKNLKRRLLILDEAWYMMKYEDSASFVYGIAKRARKYYLGLTTATQDVEDFLSTEYGKAVLSNSSIQVLMKQGPAEVDVVSKTFYLSNNEKSFLLSSAIGEGLFFAGQNHVAIKVTAAPFEKEVINTNPAVHPTNPSEPSPLSPFSSPTQPVLPNP